MNARLASGLRAAVLEHARRELPLEACGLLGGRAGEFLRFIPCRNILQSASSYAIAPEELLAAFRAFDREGMDLYGIFHSHPGGPALPSARDLREATYPDAVYLIAAPVRQELRAFRVQGEIAQEVMLEG